MSFLGANRRRTHQGRGAGVGGSRIAAHQQAGFADYQARRAAWKAGQDSPEPEPQAPANTVGLNTPPNRHTLSPQQTNAQYNYNQALAYQHGDPRYAGKQHQRGGLSSSKGTAYMGAADAANRFTSGMAAAENARMQDAYSNAGVRLADAAQRNQFSLALAGLQEDSAQRDYMYRVQSMQNAMGGFLGGSGPLSGLL